MKSFLKSLGIFLLSLLFLSCEKVIDVDLEESEPQLEIEAVLKEVEHFFEVTIAKSTSYFNRGPQKVVTDDTITLIDNEGKYMAIPHIANGVYVDSVTGVFGRTNTLAASVEGNLYEANSTLLEQVELQELVEEFEEANAFNDEGYSIFLRFQDPPNETNYYRVLHYIDGEVQKGGDQLQVVDDALFDGGYARLPIFQQVFDAGSTVKVELVHLDKASYDYFTALRDIIDTGGGPGGATAAPANPNSNWSGGILGYFSAQNSSNLTIVLPS